MKNFQVRQGDVLVERVSGREKQKRGKRISRESERIVLAHGESTGHAHAIYDQGVEAYEIEGGMLLVVEGERVSIRHEEHSPIQLPPGSYRVSRQREYQPDSIRNVAD